MTYSANLIPAMTSATAPSGVATSSSNYNTTWAEWKAFDHLNGVGYGWASIVGIPAWVGYQFPVAHVVTRYAVTTRTDDITTSPTTWTFKGSNDGSTWDTLDTQTNITGWTSGMRKVFDIANAVAYAYYRLNVTAVNTGNLVGVGELEMMETEAGGGGGTCPLSLLRTQFFPPRGVIAHG